MRAHKINYTLGLSSSTAPFPACFCSCYSATAAAIATAVANATGADSATNVVAQNCTVQFCSVMHIGSNNIQHNYTMGNQQLIATEEQRDLGITITKDLKWQNQN